jgi:hypothetical protein
MLKVVAVHEDSKNVRLILGVTAQDFANLLAGVHIQIDPRELGLPWWPGSIYVFGDTTEDRIVERLQARGAKVEECATEQEVAEKTSERIYGTTKS